MNNYDGDAGDLYPSREGARTQGDSRTKGPKGQAQAKSVRFKLGGTIDQFDHAKKDPKGVRGTSEDKGAVAQSPVKYDDLPKSLKKLN